MAGRSFWAALTMLTVLAITMSAAPVMAQAPSSPKLLGSALQVEDGVRYNITFQIPVQGSLLNVRVEATLPDDADVQSAAEIPGRTVFLGLDGRVLRWAAPSLTVGQPVDGFAFILAQPLSDDAHVRVSWDTDAGPGSTEVALRPHVMGPASAAEASLSASAAGFEDAPVGATGIQLSVAQQVVPDGTTLVVRRLGPEANPPAGAGSPWWCAEVDVEGLPEGGVATVQVPARQALPAGAPVTLFAQRGDTWEMLDQVGRTSADGQFVVFQHPGGRIAAGLQPVFQPIRRTIAPLVLAPKLSASMDGSFVLRSDSGVHWSITLKNSGNAPARDVFVDIQGPNSPADWLNIQSSIDETFHTDLCVIVQGAAILLGPNKAECTFPVVEAGQSVLIQLAGGSTVVIGSGNRDVELTAQDNFPNQPNTTANASLSYAVNP